MPSLSHLSIKTKKIQNEQKDHLMLVSWPVNSPPTLLCSLKREKHHEGKQLGNHFVQDDDDGDVVDVVEGLPEEGSPEQNHLGKKERELLRVTVGCLRVGFEHFGDHDDHVTSRR